MLGKIVIARHDARRSAAEAALKALAQRQNFWPPSRSTIAAANEALAELPPSAIAQADSWVPYSANLFQIGRLAIRASAAGDLRLLVNRPELAGIFLFHRNGHVREAALHAIARPLSSAFEVAAVCFRTNDWVPQVREAALACAQRTFPQTSAGNLGIAVKWLLSTIDWARGTSQRETLLDILLTPAARTQLVDEMSKTSLGGMGRVLRACLARPGIDDRLTHIASSARVVDVRAIAMKALLEGEIRWATGWQMTKDRGFRYERQFASRAIATRESQEELMELAARDRASAVRRLAADAFIKDPDLAIRLPEIVAKLANDSSFGVRDRIDFVQRRQRGETAF